ASRRREPAAVRRLVVGRARRSRCVLGLAGAAAAAESQPGVGPSTGALPELRGDGGGAPAVGGGPVPWVSTPHGTCDLVWFEQLRARQRAREAVLRCPPAGHPLQ